MLISSTTFCTYALCLHHFGARSGLDPGQHSGTPKD